VNTRDSVHQALHDHFCISSSSTWQNKRRVFFPCNQCQLHFTSKARLIPRKPDALFSARTFVSSNKDQFWSPPRSQTQQHDKTNSDTAAPEGTPASPPAPTELSAVLYIVGRVPGIQRYATKGITTLTCSRQIVHRSRQACDVLMMQLFVAGFDMMTRGPRLHRCATGPTSLATAQVVSLNSRSSTRDVLEQLNWDFYHQACRNSTLTIISSVGPSTSRHCHRACRACTWTVTSSAGPSTSRHYHRACRQ